MESFLGAVLVSLALVVLLQTRSAAAQLSTTDPVGFFTNLSSRLLQAEFGSSLNQIQVYPTNQYTPAVHRLFQVTANLWETQTTNETGLPTVFRPRFSVTNDAVYISSYVLVTNDSELVGLPLLDLSSSANAASLIPPDGNALVFGMPLIIGARKGLPNFNEFQCEPIVTMTRKLQLRRIGGVITETNHFFVMSITMPQAAEFWNSYVTNFVPPYRVLVTNFTTMTLTNDLGVNFSKFFTSGERFDNLTTNWPGFHIANTNSFLVVARTNLPLQPTIGYLPGSNNGGVVGFVSATNTAVFDDSQQLIMPRWGLTISNRVQAMILRGDGSIMDYVLLGNMVYQTNLTDIISDPSTWAGNAFERLWATNALGQYLSGRIGAIQQIGISLGSAGIPPPPEWASYGTFSPSTPVNEINKFRNVYYNTTTNGFLSVPFMPIRQFRVPLIWQANDPLVHYLSSDLFWLEKSAQPVAIQPAQFAFSSALNSFGGIGKLNERYKPWSTLPPGETMDEDAYNLSLKDPLVTSSDAWKFPTNTLPTVDWLGRIHRGTPWQTIYLKSSDLGLTNRVASPALWAQDAAYVPFAQKWAKWTGNTSLTDGFYTRPVRDWSLVALIASLLNTNDPRQLLSVNDQNLRSMTRTQTTGWLSSME